MCLLNLNSQTYMIIKTSKLNVSKLWSNILLIVHVEKMEKSKQKLEPVWILNLIVLMKIIHFLRIFCALCNYQFDIFWLWWLKINKILDTNIILIFAENNAVFLGVTIKVYSLKYDDFCLVSKFVDKFVISQSKCVLVKHVLL